MNDTEAFLRKIRENPDDDAPRLVFADYLDEQSQNVTGKAAKERAQWAALIRVQIAEERENPADASFWNKWAGVDITSGRELAFQATSEKLIDFVRGPNKGFYDELEASFVDLPHINEEIMNSVMPVRKLELDLPAQWESVSKYPFLSLIRDLDLSGNDEITEDCFRGICCDPQLQNLTSLNLLCYNDYEFDWLEILRDCENFPHLHHLEIALSMGDRLKALLECPLARNLEYLETHDNSVRFAELLSHSPLAKTLTTLEINEPSYPVAIGKQKWGQFKNLKRLFLSVHNKKNWSPPFLESQDWQHLTHLRLTGATLPSDILSYFEEGDTEISLTLDKLSFPQLKGILSSPAMRRVKALSLINECKESAVKILAKNDAIINLRSFVFYTHNHMKNRETFFDTLCSSPVFANLLHLQIREQLTLPILRQLNDSAFGESLRSLNCDSPKFAKKWQEFLRKSKNFPHLVNFSFSSYGPNLHGNLMRNGRKKLKLT